MKISTIKWMASTKMTDVQRLDWGVKERGRGWRLKTSGWWFQFLHGSFFSIKALFLIMLLDIGIVRVEEWGM